MSANANAWFVFHMEFSDGCQRNSQDIHNKQLRGQSQRQRVFKFGGSIMTISSEFRRLMRSLDFWRDYYTGGDSPYPDYEQMVVEFTLGKGFGLSVGLRDFGAYVGYCEISNPGNNFPFGLRILTPSAASHIEIAFYPEGLDCTFLRWDEIECLSQAIAARHADMQHPGIPLLLLCRHVCITNEAEQTQGEHLVKAAYQSAGIRRSVVEREVGDCITGVTGYRPSEGWRWMPREDGGWNLERSEGEPRPTGFTHQRTRDGAFPHHHFAALINRARQICRVAADQD
jgi:hypothetical protein